MNINDLIEEYCEKRGVTLFPTTLFSLHLQGNDAEELERLLPRLADLANRSPCISSKCAAIILSENGKEVGAGFNAFPTSHASIQPCVKSIISDRNKNTGKSADPHCCIHAEQDAIIDALLPGKEHDSIVGGRMIFARFKNGNLEASGAPYCTECSKIALRAGIKQWTLYHRADVYGTEGWYTYDADFYNFVSYH